MRKRVRAVEEPILPVTEGSWQVQLSHVAPVRSARFDDPFLVSSAGAKVAGLAGMLAGAD